MGKLVYFVSLFILGFKLLKIKVNNKKLLFTRLFTDKIYYLCGMKWKIFLLFSLVYAAFYAVAAIYVVKEWTREAWILAGIIGVLSDMFVFAILYRKYGRS